MGTAGTSFSDCKKPGWEPNDSCKKLESPTVEKDPYEAADSYILKDTTRNCCTIGADKLVTQWQLKENKTVVELRKANSGTTFYHHNRLKIKKIN